MEVRRRMADTLGGIMARPDHRCVLAVSHGGACRAFMRYWEQNQKVELHTRLYNCCILKFEYEDGKFSLVDIVNHDFAGLPQG